MSELNNVVSVRLDELLAHVGARGQLIIIARELVTCVGRCGEREEAVGEPSLAPAVQDHLFWVSSPSAVSFATAVSAPLKGALGGVPACSRLTRVGAED